MRYKDVSVSQCLQQGQWHLLIQGNLTAQARQELHQLLGTIQVQRATDEAVWTRNTTWCFTVKSAYSFITDTPHVQECYSRIWEIKAPPRVQIFVWLTMRNKILTIDNLVKRGWVITNMCYLCRANLESVQHIFNECTFSSQLRNYIASTAPPIQENCPAYTSLASTTSIIQGGGNIYWKQMEITTIFTIWKERCRRIFQEEEQQIPEVAREILKELRSWFGNQ
jgi:zinc-binding in reverse transcriptase